MSRYVIGLDPTVSAVSVAAFTEHVEQPTLKLIHAPTPTRDFSIEANVERTLATAEKTMTSVLRGGRPEVVVMMKPTLGSGHRDPSGPRRMALAGEIQRRLIDACIPVAELAPMTMVGWLLGGGRSYPPRDFGPLERTITNIWKVEPPEPGYRLTTVALAAAGAVLAGITTRCTVTNAGLAALRSMTLPRGADLPGTEPQWRAQFLNGKEAVA